MKKIKNNSMCLLTFPKIKDDTAFNCINKPRINSFSQRLFQNGKQGHSYAITK